MQFEHYSMRLAEAGDADAFFQLMDRNRARLEDFFAGTVARTRTLEDTKAYTKEIMQRIEAKTYLPHFIIDENTSGYIGFIDVKNIDWNIPKAELGFFIDTAYENQGITSQAFSILVRHLIDERKFNKLFLRTHPSNLSAIALAKKKGFRQEGLVRRDYMTTKGELVDLAYFGLIREELNEK